MQQIATVLVYAVFALLATLVIATSMIAATLKRSYPQVWTAEGRPEQWIWLNKTPVGQHIFGFLDQRRYLATGSLQFSKVCALVRVGWYGLFVLFLVAMALAAVTLLKAQA